MASQSSQTFLSEQDANSIASFCKFENLGKETFFVAAWAYVLSIYSGASFITTSLIRQTEEHEQRQNYSVSATLETQTTISKLLECLQINDLNSNINFAEVSHMSASANELHNGGTLIMFIRENASNFNLTVGEQFQASIIIDSKSCITLSCMPGSITAPSPEAVLDTFTTVVRQFSTCPSDTLLNNLDILGPLNRNTLETWSPSHLVAVKHCVHDYVDEYARRDPYKEAVASIEGPCFTYDQLSVLSSKLALHLLELGIKKGDIVPILFDKTSVAVLAIVAILKAGAAYVGFSPESPVNFLRECSSIANVSLIITSRQHEHLVESIGSHSLVIDQDFLKNLQLSALMEPFSSPAQPVDLAYIVFTSGSTGVPKAVMIEHQAYVTDALAQQKAALLTATSRVLNFASFNFDATNFDILSTLIAGGTICVPSEFDRINRLAGAINDLRANFLGVTATIAQILDPEEVPLLKVVILCGEANSPEIVNKWTKCRATKTDVINGYGPSEASCAFSYNIYTRQSPQANNIGCALEGACWGRVANAENHNQLLPVGAVGELLIQGPTLSRGYLNDPEKTTKAFISSPCWLSQWNTPEFRRLYRTGDLVRQLPDQSFEIFGRIDTQVKLNGQRIELGEIEHKINRALGGTYVTAVEAVTLSAHGPTHSKALIAFYATSVGTHHREGPLINLLDQNESVAIDVQSIKRKLAEDLKPIAIPQAFIPLRVIPITIQGKLDRKSLQSLGVSLDEAMLIAFSGGAVSGDDSPVTSEFEKTIQELFAQSLSLSKVLISRDSNFFDLGGDSLKGIKFVSLAKKLGLNVSVPDILQRPQLSELAEFLSRSKRTNTMAHRYQPFDAIAKHPEFDELRAKAKQCVSVAADIEDITQATDLQASCVAFSTYKEERRGINWLICDFVTPQDERIVRHICEVMTARHAILRTFFFTHRRTLYQVVSKSFRPPIRTQLQLKDICQSTNAIMQDDINTRTVEMGQPQTAFELMSHGDATGIERLVIRMSAAQYDGHSVAILRREIASILKVRRGNYRMHDALGSYPAYLYHARAIELEEGIKYWRSLLADAVMPQITREKSGKCRPSSGLDFVDGVLVKMVETRLLDLSVNRNSNMTFLRGSTRATIVKTAWALTLAELTGKDDVVFGSTGWGRNNSIDFAQDVMGSCTSHVPTRARLTKYADGNSSRLTYGELVEQLHSQHIASMRFENIGANTIVEKCTSWRRWTRFSSLLVFQGLDIETAPEKHSSDENGKQETPGFKFTEIMDPGDRADVIIHVEPFGEQTRLMMAFAEKNLPREVAGVMLQTFERYLELVTRCTDHRITLTDRKSPPLLPVIYKYTGFDRVESQQPVDTRDARAEQLVREVWMKVLDVNFDMFGELKETNASFLEVWGNPVSAAALADAYRRKGLDVLTEDILRKQTVQEQILLISSRI
ncbi:nonribosomal peptide [Colletotrichum truncatum]|uniref:Nonribosomal peptide n=1 Tax=Colletotrichum truncatum TaxID=5467 RepID=A0ACC3YEB4_COLTU|nr:nonribosomal peptide [Colletotrichum truncatum]KAF6790160.1 nonribosomal peptide [Colletotrichum truncatum]